MKMFDVYPLQNVSVVRAEGSWVWDSEGNKYLDMYGGHAVISIGHTHPEYVKALTEQLGSIGFYSNSVVIERQQRLAEKLGRLSGKESNRLFLVNSGAEANENAIKLASFATGRRKVVAFSASFHGRTSLAVAATDNRSIVAPVNETDNVVFSEFNDGAALERLFAEQGGEIACVIIEAIQGVGGIKVADAGFLRLIRTLCDRCGAVMIADEVQCGCGRTGRYYATDWAGVQADIYTMAKGIGNGFPVGAISVGSRFEARYGMLGTTFGGSYLACAAMEAVADVMEREGLVAHAGAMGDYLTGELKKLSGPSEVRGRGLMIGIELPFEMAELKRRLLTEEHIFVGAAGKNVIRLLPALNITREHADRFLTSFSKLLTSYCR